jgi:hypothetical protein
MSIKNSTDYWIKIFNLIPDEFKKNINKYQNNLINKPAEYFNSYYGWINFRSVLIIDLPNTCEENYKKYPWLKEVVDTFNEGIKKFNKK